MKSILLEEELREDNKFVCLYFFASWMPFDKKMKIMIEKMEKKREDVTFLAIDVERHKSLCVRFKVDSVPTIVINKDGKEVKRIVGLVLTSAFNKTFNELKE